MVQHSPRICKALGLISSPFKNKQTNKTYNKNFMSESNTVATKDNFDLRQQTNVQKYYYHSDICKNRNSNIKKFPTSLAAFLQVSMCRTKLPASWKIKSTRESLLTIAIELREGYRTTHFCTENIDHFHTSNIKFTGFK